MELEIHFTDGEEWAALYADGKLVPNTVGDSYLAMERALDLAGVKCVYNDAFMRGQNKRDGVAQTLEEVIAYDVERSDRLTQAEALRQEAELLLEQAKQLEDG